MKKAGQRSAGLPALSMRSWWRAPWIQAVALMAITLAVYLPALGGAFIWDDRMYLTQGALMRSPLWRLWIRPEAIDYLPLTYTSFWLQWRLWPDNAAAFHVVNVLLHGGAAVVLWRLLLHLKVRGAWMAAAIFAVHPVAAESVAWIAEEKNTLSLLLAAVALLLYLQSEKRRRRYWPAVAMFALALLAKPAVIMLPLVLLLLAWWKRGAITRDDWRRSAPFFVLSAVFAPITIWYQRRSIGVEHMALGGVGDRVGQASKALWFYVYKLLLPRQLVFFYPRWSHSGLDAASLAGFIALVALAAALWHWRGALGRGPLAAVASFVALLLPVLGLLDMAWLQFAPVADHYQYPAMIVLIAAVVAGGIALGQAAAGQAAAGQAAAGQAVKAWRYASVVRSAVAAMVLLVLGGLTVAQSRNYRDEDTLWRATVARNPKAWAAWAGLGLTASERGETQAAIESLRRAAEANPRYSAVHNNLGAEYEKNGNMELAISEYEAAVRINPRLAQPQYNLGILLMRQQRPAEAEAHLARAAEMMPGSAAAAVKLGLALLQQDKLERAAQELSRAVQLNPASFEAHAYLAECLRKQGKNEAAFAEYQRAIALKR